MPTKIRGKSDSQCKRIAAALASYEAQHPAAEIEVYRQNSASIRIRVIDAGVAGMDFAARHDAVWKYLDSLSDDDLAVLSLLLVLTPDEAKDAFATFNFETPLRSRL